MIDFLGVVLIQLLQIYQWFDCIPVVIDFDNITDLFAIYCHSISKTFAIFQEGAVKSKGSPFSRKSMPTFPVYIQLKVYSPFHYFGFLLVIEKASHFYQDPPPLVKSSTRPRPLHRHFGFWNFCTRHVYLLQEQMKYVLFNCFRRFYTAKTLLILDVLSLSYVLGLLLGRRTLSTIVVADKAIVCARSNGWTFD